MHDHLIQDKVQNVTILGATGTIGLHTLDVISQHPARFRVFALTASTNVKGLFDLCQQYASELNPNTFYLLSLIFHLFISHISKKTFY